MAENDWMDAKRFDSSRDPYFLPVLSIPKGGVIFGSLTVKRRSVKASICGFKSHPKSFCTRLSRCNPFFSHCVSINTPAKDTYGDKWGLLLVIVFKSR